MVVEKKLRSTNDQPCCHLGSEERGAIVGELEGALFVPKSCFAYFMVVAVEAGSIPRGVVLLLVYPIVLFLQHFVSRHVATQLLAFVSLAGLYAHDIHKVARVVLPRFMSAEVCADTWRVFNSNWRRKVVVTEMPAAMVGPFADEYLGVNEVWGPQFEIDVATGKATGLLVKNEEAEVAAAVKETPELGLWGVYSDHHLMGLCKEVYKVEHDSSATRATPASLKATTIFHDGRFVYRPDPLWSLLYFLWMPLGFILSLVRIFFFLCLPPRIAPIFLYLSGVHLVVKGSPPRPKFTTNNNITTSTTNRLFVLNHKNNLDPIFVCLALGRRLPCVTYRLNRLFQLLSPIPTIALTRERAEDAAKISSLLKYSDLLMCPEGTISREPYLLRFSALFAELSHMITPIAINTKQTMFHGTTFHGSKIMDPFFFFMNPRPAYEITFLDPLHEEDTCMGGKTSIEVANHVQKVLGERLGFKCLTLARKDKYIKLGGGGEQNVVGSLSSKTN